MREVVVDTAGCNGAWVEWGRGRERVVSEQRQKRFPGGLPGVRRVATGCRRIQRMQRGAGRAREVGQ